MSPAKRRLLELEREGYVFHGSENSFNRLEPKQSYIIINEEEIKDGEPAVFASQFADIAIFMAIINETNCPKGFRSGFSYEDSKLSFRATQETLDQITPQAKGYVHVFKKEDFKFRSECQMVSFSFVTPLEILEVSADDLPENIVFESKG